MIIKCWITCSLISFFLMPVAGSGQSLEHTIAIGDSMRQNKEYTQALYFYQRARFFSTGGQRSALAQKMAHTYILLQDYPKMAAYFDYAINSAPNDSVKWEIQFEKMASSMQFGMFKEAYQELLSLPDSMPHEQWQHRRNYYAGVIYLGLNDLENAQQSFLSVLPPDDSVSAKMIGVLFAHQKHKSIRLARGLSHVIPGSGQIYAGDYRAGVNSFLLTGIIATMGVASGISYGWTGSVWSVTWFLRYYRGGIRGAELSARKKNAFYREKLYQNIVPIISRDKAATH